MHTLQKQAHVTWDCKYHIVLVPKYRQRVIYGRVRVQLGRILRELCQQRQVGLIEGHAMPDHIHLCLSIPPRESVARVVGFLKGKSAIRLHRQAGRRRGPAHFWARGYFVSTVGLDERVVRQYIRNQYQQDKLQEALFPPPRGL